MSKELKKSGKQDKKVVVMGAGLVGALLGCYLARRGFKVDIYERRDDMRKVHMSAGRSINLALSERGIQGLAGVGLKDEVMKIAIPMKGRMMHSVDGKLTFQPYSKDGKSAIYSVSRGELNSRLMTLAEQREGINLIFDSKCIDFDLKSGEVTMENEITKEITKIQPQTVFGCDGAFSAVRTAMSKFPRFDYSQSYLTHGYKELHMPADANGNHKMEKNCLHIWPRGSFMMIALPNLDGSFTCTCFFPFGGENGFDRLDKASDSEVMEFFKSTFGDAVEMMPTLIEDWRRNPTSSLVTIRCSPWAYKDRGILFGDAAHAIVPFFGQGMNAAFEDCTVFESLMDKYKNEESIDWAGLFKAFAESRKPNADAIADMALENFIEMRDLVADPHFLFKKKVQHLLGNTFPDHFLSRYEMVSFSQMPYKECVRLGRLCDDIVDELIKEAGEENIDKINLETAKKLIEKTFPLPILQMAKL